MLPGDRLEGDLGSDVAHNRPVSPAAGIVGDHLGHHLVGHADELLLGLPPGTLLGLLATV